MSLAGLSFETATRRTGGPEGDLADSMRERMEERVEKRCLARAGSTSISAVEGCFASVMVALGCYFVETTRVSLDVCICKEYARSFVDWMFPEGR